jgi:signal transduction histidine kinase
MKLGFKSEGKASVLLTYSLTNQHRPQADRNKLLRILVNIFDNAGDAVPATGSIHIRIREFESKNRRWVRFCVANSGSYIRKEDRERIFEPFFTEGKSRGTGLGLAIVKKLITAHEGKLQCRSSPRWGTAFWFTLPASNVNEPTPTALPKSIAEATPHLSQSRFDRPA